MQTLMHRFFRYIKIDTQSDPLNEDAFPSTEKQWDLAKLLVKEIKAMGLQDISIDDHAYIMATLPSNVEYKVPVIGFIAHMDTSPDFSGANVKPHVHENYDGKDIVLNKKQNIVMSADYFGELKLYKGQTLITTDGRTLLGADDKAGIVEILEAMQYLIDHPEIKHGDIRIGFTPDEEVGKGAHKFDVKKFNAEWAYTVDGSRVGELEFENFNAAGGKVVIKGKNVHPGYAKNKMINSMMIAADFIKALPAEEVPEHTQGREGFFHLHTIKGGVEETELEYIIRDHDMSKFNQRKVLFKNIAEDMNKVLGEDLIKAEVKDQYFNMREKLEPMMHIVDIAEQAMKDLGIKPRIQAIRGGTDGSQLSYKGLPCPNIFAGGHNFHGKYEFITLESMQKAKDVVVKIAELTAVRYKNKY
ncbi:MAG: peptidase T [Proteobacteria bacterium]|nr:peptidase T [Pseudomonadota bacterium]